MAKNEMMPMPSGGGSVLPKLIGTAVVLALVAMVIKQPAATADWVGGIFNWAIGAVEGISEFFQQLTG